MNQIHPVISNWKADKYKRPEFSRHWHQAAKHSGPVRRSKWRKSYGCPGYCLDSCQPAAPGGGPGQVRQAPCGEKTSWAETSQSRWSLQRRAGVRRESCPERSPPQSCKGCPLSTQHQYCEENPWSFWIKNNSKNKKKQSMQLTQGQECLFPAATVENLRVHRRRVTRPEAVLATLIDRHKNNWSTHPVNQRSFLPKCFFLKRLSGWLSLKYTRLKSNCNLQLMVSWVFFLSDIEIMLHHTTDGILEWVTSEGSLVWTIPKSFSVAVSSPGKWR